MGRRLVAACLMLAALTLGAVLLLPLLAGSSRLVITNATGAELRLAVLSAGDNGVWHVQQHRSDNGWPAGGKSIIVQPGKYGWIGIDAHDSSQHGILFECTSTGARGWLPIALNPNGGKPACFEITEQALQAALDQARRAALEPGTRVDHHPALQAGLDDPWPGAGVKSWLAVVAALLFALIGRSLIRRDGQAPPEGSPQS